MFQERPKRDERREGMNERERDAHFGESQERLGLEGLRERVFVEKGERGAHTSG